MHSPFRAVSRTVGNRRQLRLSVAAASGGEFPDLWSLTECTDDLWKVVDIPPPPVVSLLALKKLETRRPRPRA